MTTVTTTHGLAMNAPSVLIVDDEPAVRRLLGALLQGRGYRPMLAADGVEARAAVETEDVAVVLCDLHLRRESGAELVQDLLRRSPHTVALLMSGERAPDLEPGEDGGGRYGFIAKPFEGKDLVNRIDQALCGRCLGQAPLRASLMNAPQLGWSVQ